MPDISKNEAPHWADPDTVNPDGTAGRDTRDPVDYGDAEPLVAGLDALVSSERWGTARWGIDHWATPEQVAKVDVLDEFLLVVTYANERTASDPPAFLDYDAARQAGADLLLNHADAVRFSIVKSTRLNQEGQ